MKYYRWKLKWEDGEGTDFVKAVNEASVTPERNCVEPHFSSTADLTDPATWIYGYLLYGNVDVTDLAPWSAEELSASEMLAAAAMWSTGVTLDENGKVQWPVIEE